MPRGTTAEAAVLETVAARLAHAMHETHAPVDRMGAALERMMRALARSARALERLSADGRAAAQERSAEALEDLHECRETLEREIATCIESLQFHDRLMQHLAQVRGGLAALAQRPHAGVADIRKPDAAPGSIELF